MVTRGNSETIIVKNKKRRSWTTVRTALKESQNVSEVTSLYRDGRRDTTYVNEKRGNRFYTRKVFEEHISVITEPGNNV